MNVGTVTRELRWDIIATVVGVTVLISVMAPFRSEVGLLNEGLLFLLLTLLIAAAWEWKVGLFAGVLTNPVFNLFFVDPAAQLNRAEAA